MALPVDNYAGTPRSITTSSDEWAVITPHNTNTLADIPKAIACGATAGTIVCVDRFGNEATFHMAAGQVLPIRPAIIKATGTTATPIIALK